MIISRQCEQHGGKKGVLNKAMPVVGGGVERGNAGSGWGGLYTIRKIKFHLTQMPVAAFI